MDKSVTQARGVDHVVEWVANQGIGLLGVHPWLKETTAMLQPHRTILKVLDIGREQVEERCRS
ncbi:MAG: hypothetical protein M0Z41_11160 [Peptococcaceae bacterium]|jgi:hypothetical protein|nr:hypothetical protein [Peptococcaceae bacterium]